MRISVSAKQLVMPSVCACCGGASETTIAVTSTRISGKRVIRTKTSEWNFPVCARCGAHDREWPTASAVEVLLLTILTCGIYLYFYVKRRQRAFAMCTSACSPPRRAIAYLGWFGTVHHFDVVSEVFAGAFLASSAKKLVELDATARRLLDSPAIPAQGPVPALVLRGARPQGVAAPFVPPPAALPRRDTPPRPASPLPVAATAAQPDTPLRITTPPPKGAAPARPERAATETFLGQGTSIAVAGRVLQEPFTYVVGHASDVDASTIVTSLPAGRAAGAEPLPLWPSYVAASPQQRGAYLDWLAGDRTNPETPIGYVFIHFYGLERRMLVDQLDHEVLRAELKRLLSIYGDPARSFQSYASNLLTFVALPALSGLSEFAVYAQLADLAADNPTALSALLAWFHLHGRPLPVRHAMLVASTMEGAKGGTVVTRAKAELEELFSIRYRERCGDGVRLEASQRPQVVQYFPASPSFRRTSRQLRISIPNVLGRPSQFEPLVALWNECLGDLRKLSLARRERADAPLTADAWLALPPELREDYDHPDQDRWDETVLAAPPLGAFRIISAGRLAMLAGISVDDRVTGARLRRAVETAALLGYAVEPDARVAARSMPANAELAIWRTKATAVPDPKLWKSVHTMLSLTLSVAASDGAVADEEAHTVHVLIEELYTLDEEMRTRVAALRWILSRQPARATAIAKRLKESRSAAELAKVGRVLVAVAAVDGVVVEREHQVLKGLYKAMGLPPSALSSAIVASGAYLESDAPVQVRAAGPGANGEAIPRPRDARPAGLDAPAIAAILAETREVALLLAEVLEDEDEPEPAAMKGAPARAAAGSTPAPNGVWSSLDARYHVVLRELLSRSSWTVGEVRSLATRSKLMPGAILEVVNTWAEERFGEQVIEEAGDWRVRADILERATT